MSIRAAIAVLTAAAAVAICGAAVQAHSGPPFPIASNRAAGPYVVSIWTDPDTTDDGRTGGQFWVMLEDARRGATLPAGTHVTVAIRPIDRPGPSREGRAEPVDGLATRQFVSLLMDHEGRFGVGVTVEGPLGPAEVESQVEATYDQRPPGALLAVYLFPFVAVGALWVRVLLRRRRTRSERQP